MRARVFFRTGWLNITLQLAVLALLYQFGATRQTTSGGAGGWAIGLIVFGLSALWSTFFYLQDRDQPEPTRHVIASFLLGMAAAGIVAIPVEENVFALSQWMHTSLLHLILGEALVRGTLFGLILFVGLRYWFLPSAEFDEPEDGMVYGAFIGTGFAAMRGLAELGQHPGATWFATGYLASTAILVHASVGALAGYQVGKAKFGGNAVRAGLVALLGSAGLIALYGVLDRVVFLAGFEHTLWASIVMTVLFASAILLLATRTMVRLDRHIVPTPSPVRLEAASNVWVLVVAAALLAGAGISRHAAERDVRFVDQRIGVSFSYPPLDLVPAVAPGSFGSAPRTAATLFRLRGGAEGGAQISVDVKPIAARPGDLNVADYLGSSSPIAVSTENIQIGGRAAQRLRSAFIPERGDRIGGLPRLLWRCTDVIRLDDRTVVFAYQADPSTFRSREPLYERILSSVDWVAPRGAAK